MSGSSKILLVILSVLAGSLARTVSAAERATVDRMIACASESNDATRLACYDREIAGVKPPVAKSSKQASPAAPGSAAAAVPAKPTPAVVAPGAQENFGLHGSEAARQRKSEEQKQPDKADVSSLTAKVTGVSSRPRGELVMDLDNGQTWVQKKPEPYFPVKVGDAVTINAGMLGSFRLVNGPRSTQVTRVK